MTLSQLRPSTMRTYQYIVGFIEQKGFGPTLREIKAGVPLSSTSVATYHRGQLMQAGLVTFDPGRGRSIAIAGALTLTYYGDDADFIRREFGDNPELTVMDRLKQEVGVMEYGT